MIVNTVPEGWQVIYQQAHGILAAQLAYHLKPELRCQHWTETIVAIANHDNRQKNWCGKEALTPAGAPADFTLLPATLDQAKDLMYAVRFESRWVTLLTSMHMSFIYESNRGKNKDYDLFLDDQLAIQRSCRKDLGITKKEAEKAYAIMQWCDSFSLILCRNELPAGGRALEIAVGPDEKTYFVRQLENKTIRVEPWPFVSDELEVQVEYRILEKLQYKDDQELAEALHQAKVKYKSWQFTCA